MFLHVLHVHSCVLGTACPFYSLLLMKDRSFLYELRAYRIYVKVGEIQTLARKQGRQ